ncbi:MAG: hypothetical protein Q8Q63_01860 [Phaeovulum sp.]|uniref:hypothetical protein n=1 Tax=Phaeovulum sp. TaxID=2934796 RepID=UPI00273168A7|nr:hypothetical protein [Phaeovulum sp.]MDP2063405.1 hypothetical protein [Phaeovulum sp.]MDP3860311.1 hypothetical protein [Phaeovulum sp.]
MQVAFHIGAHFTDEERLLRTLLANAPMLAGRGIVVPEPGRYRRTIRDLLVALKGAPADRETQETLLDAVTSQDHIQRLILSNDNFMGFPARMIGKDGFHALAPARLRALANLFPTDTVEFHIGLINPATLIPQLLGFVKGADYESLMCGLAPTALRWTPVVQRMAQAVDGRRMVIWCNEDTPLIWPEVVRRVAGVEPESALQGDDAVLETIMAAEGMARMKAYMGSHPPQTAAQRRKIASAFLDKFGLAERIEIEVPLPGWNDALVADLTAAYDADVAEIAALPGVEFIAP